MFYLVRKRTFAWQKAVGTGVQFARSISKIKHTTQILIHIHSINYHQRTELPT